MSEWLFLVYKVPREPTASRVGIWRKLKQLGGLRLHDAVWVLPATERNQEQLQWLAAEIGELKGESTLARSQILDAAQDQQLTADFQAQADAAYREVLTGLKNRKHDTALLSRRFQQAQGIDFFGSKLAARARQALLAASGRKKT